jgi:secretion/DNA translocation related CpaE-like protein
MTTPPLLLTRDPDLVEDLRRLALVAGVEPDVVTSAAEARRTWGAAPLVVVGDDLVDEAARAGLRRRADVVVATLGSDADVPWRAALALGAEHVVVLPAAETFLVERLAAGETAALRRATVVGIVGGTGGAGASVLAAALAVASARLGHSTVLVDADPMSGGLDLVLGCESRIGARWQHLADVTGVLAPDDLRTALPSVHGVDVLAVSRSGDVAVPVAAVPAVLDSAMSAYDVVVLDLPRGHPDLLELLVSRCDDVLLVVPLDVRGASASVRLAAWLAARARTGLVARHLPHSHLDPDDLATWLELDVAAELAHDRRISASLDQGEAPGTAPRTRLARTCRVLVSGLVVR